MWLGATDKALPREDAGPFPNEPEEKREEEEEEEEEAGHGPRGADPIDEEGSCAQGSCSRSRRLRQWSQPSPPRHPARLPRPAYRRPSPARPATSSWWGRTPCSTGG